MGILFDDRLIMLLSITMTSAVLGFFILNYPNGLIFLGDGGAYFIGLWVALLSVALVARNNQVSAWFALLIVVASNVSGIVHWSSYEALCKTLLGCDHIRTYIFRHSFYQLLMTNTLSLYISTIRIKKINIVANSNILRIIPLSFMDNQSTNHCALIILAS